MCARPIGPASHRSGTDNTSEHRDWGRHLGIDGRSVAARRYKALIAAFEDEIGGGNLGEADRSLIEQAAMLQLRVEQLTSDVINGRPVDDGLIVKIAGTSRRALAAISAKRAGRKPGVPTLQEYLAQRAAQRHELEANDEADDGTAEEETEE